MNRRKPPLRLAVVAMAPGEDRQTAVLRKAASMALDALTVQIQPDLDDAAWRRFSPFLSGYLTGHAQQVALKHGIGGDVTSGLAAELGRQLAVLPNIEISGVQTTKGEAGYLVGRLEALCGTRHLIREAFLRWHQCATADAGSAFLTDCDNAADPMQSRAPTMSLRFSPDERAVILAAFRTFAAP